MINYLGLFALVAGMAISMQAAMNAQLGVLLKNSLFATAIAFGASCLFTLLALGVSTKDYPTIDTLHTVPFYLWFGGVLSAFGVGMFYYLIPKMGVGPMMSYALTGQIIIAIIASHFGWFEMPVKHINATKVAGVIALIAGILLINWKSQ